MGGHCLISLLSLPYYPTRQPKNPSQLSLAPGQGPKTERKLAAPAGEGGGGEQALANFRPKPES
eukprot:5877235-Alexandrium_andersonii.AAC.1